MKKTLIALLVAVTMVLALAVSVSAAGTATVTASAESAKVGDNITFTVALSGTEAGTSSAPQVSYSDEYFEFVSAEYKKSGAMLSTYNETNKVGALAFTSATDFNGDYFAITLKVKAASPDAQTVSIQVQVKNGSTEVANVSGSASVKCVCATHTWGNWFESVPATYDAAGTETHTCSVCGESENREIARLKRLESIAVKTAPAKTEYEVGDTLDTTGLALTLIYNYGENGEATEGFTTEGFDSALGGEKTVTVTYEGKTTTFTVNVVKHVTEISVKTAPAKTEYEVGDTLDTTGLVLTANYNDNTSGDVTEGFTTEGFDSTLSGEKTVTVTYEDKTATFTVNVVKRLASIAVKTNPTKTEYEVGDTLDTTGLVLTLTYNDNTTDDVTEGFTTEGFDSELGGEKTVTVAFDGKTTTFTVNVVKRVVSIAVKTNPTKTEYYIGDDLDAEGLVLTVTYNDNTTADVTEGFTTEGFDSAENGEKTVTVTYEDKTATFTVNVAAAPAPTDGAAQTGDNGMALWIAVMVLSLVGVAGTVYSLKRRRA